MKTIHCFGCLVVDLLSGPLKQYPIPKVQTQVTTESVRIMPGGGAANTTSALARMGLQVGVFSKVGDDLTGEFIRRELGKLGVDTTGIQVSARDTTPMTYVGIHADGDRTFIHTPGANATLSWNDFNIDRVLAADYLLYQDLWVLAAMDGEAGARLLAAAQKRGVVTFLDECFGNGPKRESLELMLPYCDYVTPSADDLRVIYPGASDQELAERLLGLGARVVVLKMGREGCLVAQGDDRIRVAAVPAKMVDSTGAGDCWDAGFIAGLAHGEDVVTAARIGNACAAFSIEAIGGSTGVPSYEAVRRRATQRL